jgi:hypothetical protein
MVEPCPDCLLLVLSQFEVQNLRDFNSTSAPAGFVRVPITNHSFETPTVTANTSEVFTNPTTGGFGAGWTIVSAGPGGGSNYGVVNPTTAHYGAVNPLPAPFDGNQMGYINVFGTHGTDFGEVHSDPVGTLGSFGPLETWTLEVLVGVRRSTSWVSDYEIGLELLDGTKLPGIGGSASGLVAGNVVNLSYAFGDVSAYLGEQVRVYIRGTTNGQLVFDDVRLTVTYVPEPAGIGLASLGLLAALASRRRRIMDIKLWRVKRIEAN